jgi:polyhydroxybutyrate depolymerase
MAVSSWRAALGLGVVVVLVACGDDDTGGIGDPGAPDGGTDGPGDTVVDSGILPQPTAGCGATGVKTGFVGSQSITSGGSKRSYELYVPDAYDGKKTYPLVFVFHGDGGTGAGIRSSFKLEEESGGGAIFVYPDGENKTWVIGEAGGLKADVAFIDAIAADLGKSHCTDSKRVFAVGFSKGAYFTNMLACLSKSNLRAVVSHAGGGPFGLDGSGTSYDNKGNLVCPAPPVAALQVQGTSDTSVPPDEGMKARDYWRSTNGCKTSTKAYDPSPCVAYDGCAPERPEVWCLIPGMNHTIWPQNGTKVTWAFLKTK